MLVSHKKRFIYTKTVKTAGTSVESYFERFCMKEEDWEFSHGRREHVSDSGIVGVRTASPLEIQMSIWWNHMPAKTIRVLVGPTVWDQYFKFCVVRNPFDKMVSAFHYFSRMPMRTVTLKSIVSNLKARIGTLHNAYNLKNRFEEWLDTIPMPIDQNKYMIDGRFCMDYVIKFESLLEGIEEVCNNLHIEFQPENLVHLKKSKKPRTQLRDYYSQKSINIVSKAYEYECKRLRNHTFRRRV